MADDTIIDVELESKETPEDSQPEEKTKIEETDKSSSLDVKKPDSEIEAEWGKLTGKTQDRIVSIIRENKALKARDTGTGEGTNVSSPKEETASKPSEQEVKEAVDKLKEFGVATKDDLSALQDRMYLDREHNRLETRFSGSGNMPKYDREEVEDYARSHYFGGNLEAAYNDMYRDELIDAEVKSRTKKTRTYTEKPVSSTKIGEKPLTVDSLRERLRKPDGPEWWAKNSSKIEPLLGKLSQG